MSRWLAALAVLGALCCGCLLAGSAGTASAHPLGNFTVNHYDGLTVHPDGVELLAVVDSAEIPTLQERLAADADRDGDISPAEADAAAATRCDQVRADIALVVGGEPVPWTVHSAVLGYPSGQAGLPTTRLSCQLSAAADVGRAGTLSVRDSYRADHIGWREITAAGEGVGLPDSPVPSGSVSDALRAYPDDLLSAPLDVRAVTLRVTAPGAGSAPRAARGLPGPAGVLDATVARATRAFGALAGTDGLTPLIGLLAVVLSLVLGASHAMLPGHGKTVMAAYLAGSRGSARDAVLVGATVTITHTAGVLALGLAVTVSSAVAGEAVLRWLGLLSGLLVAGIGAAMLRGAWRSRPRTAAVEHALQPAGAARPAIGHGQDHGHGHGHGHGHRHGYGRVGLVGLGVAGGLVPSPSALVVLLGAVALGRTWFGVLLVLGYGLGMAATLTAAGLLLVRLRDRLERLAVHRLGRRLSRVTAALPVLTAGLVLVVGLGLAARAVTGIG
jgi:ABC-type nickel/cobalt efflux system permease component RcnA